MCHLPHPFVRDDNADNDDDVYADDNDDDADDADDDCDGQTCTTPLGWDLLGIKRQFYLFYPNVLRYVLYSYKRSGAHTFVVCIIPINRVNGIFLGKYLIEMTVLY